MAEQEITLPGEVLVRCPKLQFQMARVTACAGCEHFRGLADRFPDGMQSFDKRYMVLCVGEPTKRELFKLA